MSQLNFSSHEQDFLRAVQIYDLEVVRLLLRRGFSINQLLTPRARKTFLPEPDLYRIARAAFGR